MHQKVKGNRKVFLGTGFVFAQVSIKHCGRLCVVPNFPQRISLPWVLFWLVAINSLQSVPSPINSPSATDRFGPARYITPCAVFATQDKQSYVAYHIRWSASELCFWPDTVVSVAFNRDSAMSLNSFIVLTAPYDKLLALLPRVFPWCRWQSGDRNIWGPFFPL